MFSNERNSSKNYTTKIGKKIFFFKFRRTDKSRKYGKTWLQEGVSRPSEGDKPTTKVSHFFVLLSNMEWQARWHSAREAGWLADWVGGEEVGEARPPVPSLLRCDQAPLREQWPL